MVLWIFYQSPTFPKKTALGKIEAYLSRDVHRDLMVFGDWNTERQSKSGQEFQQMMKKFGLKIFPEACEPSTDYMTTIDYLFTSVNIADSFFYESLISDHKPLICLVNQPRF